LEQRIFNKNCLKIGKLMRDCFFLVVFVSFFLVEAKFVLAKFRDYVELFSVDSQACDLTFFLFLPHFYVICFLTFTKYCNIFILFSI